MKFFIKNIKDLSADNKGFSLIELIIAVAVITVIASAFAAATMGSTQANMKNAQRQEERNDYISELDVKASSDKSYIASDGYNSVDVKMYMDGSGTPFDTKQCYKIEKGGYKAYAKKAD